MIPGRSLASNTAGCSPAPVATTIWPRADRGAACPGARDEAALVDADRASPAARCSMRDSAATRSASRVAASVPLARDPVVAGDRPPPMPEMAAEPVASSTRTRSLRRRGLERREAARRATADDDDIGMEVRGAGCSSGRDRVDPAQACRVSEHPLVQRPEEPRPDERLVVEADRQEPIERSVSAMRSRRSEGQAFCDRTRMPSATGVDAGPDVGAPIDLDQAVGAAAAAHSSPRGRWYLKLRDRTSTPLGRERGADRVAVQRRRRPAVEGERMRAAAGRRRGWRPTGRRVRALSHRRGPGSACPPTRAPAPVVEPRRQAVTPRRLARPCRPEDAVVAGVALRLEPAAAAGTMEPPRPLHPGGFDRR